MKNIRAAILAAAAMGVVLSAAMPTAVAMNMPDYMDVHCLAQDRLRYYLKRAYGEGQVAAGELANGNRVELFVSRRGSWTLVELTPDGHGCVQAYGRNMDIDRQAIPIKPHRS